MCYYARRIEMFGYKILKYQNIKILKWKNIKECSNHI